VHEVKVAAMVVVRVAVRPVPTAMSAATAMQSALPAPTVLWMVSNLYQPMVSVLTAHARTTIATVTATVHKAIAHRVNTMGNHATTVHVRHATKKRVHRVMTTTTFNRAPMRTWAPKVVSMRLVTKHKVAVNANPTPHAPVSTS
jgi:hypothetical protein